MAPLVPPKSAHGLASPFRFYLEDLCTFVQLWTFC